MRSNLQSIFRIFLLIMFAAAITSCGVKGKLKTPDQIKNISEEKAKKEAEKKQENPADNTDMNVNTETK